MIRTILIVIFLFRGSLNESQYQKIQIEMFKYFKNTLIYSLAEAAITQKLSMKCISFLQSAIEYEEDLYLVKMYTDSGKSTNDLGSYLDCMSIDYDSYTKSTYEIRNNLTYLLVHILPPLNEKKLEYIFGLCAPYNKTVCSVLDYQVLIYKVFESKSKTKIGLEDITVYNMQKEKQDKGYIVFVKFIPLIIILLMILFCLIPFLPKLICYPCLRNKSKEDKQNLLHCFSLIKNSYELLSNNQRGNYLITNDNGLSIITGLRGLAMIFFIIGSTFKHLYDSPVRIFVPEVIQGFVNFFRFVLVLFGLRYAKNILFALSAFTLIYKMINYLDDDEDKNQNNNYDVSFEDSDYDNEFSFNIEGTINKNEENSSNQDDQFNFLDQYSKKRMRLKVVSLFYFIFRQAYKYIIFIFGVVIFKYCLYESLAILSSPTPVWFYFKEAIINSFDPLMHFLSNIFLYSSFSIKTFFNFDLFMMAYNEIFFFIIFSIVIFIGYKWNKRLDVFFIVLLLLCIISKALLTIFLPDIQKGEFFYPSKVYQKTYYSFILSNPLYNMPSALIGLFFGLVYFSVQNPIKATNIRRFLIIPNAISNALLTNKILKLVLFVVNLIVFFACVMLFLYTFPFYSNTNVFFFDNTIVNIVALYDVDIGLISFFMFILSLFLLGNNFFITFLTNDYWNFISRPFFLFLVDMNIISYYIFYQSESTVKLELFNLLFYSLLIFLVMLVVNSFLFIFVEIPLKKLNKLIIKTSEMNKQKKVPMMNNSNISIGSRQ